jgi:surface antigen
MALAVCVMFGSMAMGLSTGDAATTDRRGGEASRAAKPASPAAAAKSTRPATAAATSTPRARQASATAPRAQKVRHTASTGSRNFRHATWTSQGGGLSCVPYARMVTGMQVSGNGGQWWYNAAGLYARGARPEPGAVMTFRASGGMSRGHVAVVSRVLGPRHVHIDHANWSGPGVRRGTVMRDVNVIDVSERNDWSAVRVQVGHDAGTFGRTYPTYGFIYNRPDTMTYFAGTTLRGNDTATRATSVSWQEMAEAPVVARSARATTPEGSSRRRR